MKTKKYTENGLCIKCQGNGTLVNSDLTCSACTVCNGMGMKYRKPRGPRKVLIPNDAADFIANSLNSDLDSDDFRFNGQNILDALDAYNKQRA